MTTWNVTTMNDPSDNGCTMSFTSVRAAMACLAWATSEALWFVSMWKTTPPTV